MDKTTLDEIERIFDHDIRGKYVMDSTGSISAVGSRRKDFATHMLEVYTSKFAPKYPSVSPKDFSDHIGTLFPPPSVVGGCLDLDKAVAEYVKETGLIVSPDGKCVTWGEFVDVSPQDLKENLKVWCYKRNVGLSREDTKYSSDAMFAGFYTMLQSRNVQVWDDLRTNLACKPKLAKTLPSKLDIVLRALKVDASDKDRFNADRRMLAHWMWTVKRRLCKIDHSPALPLLIVFRGRQGGGKTSFIQNHLCSVFSGKVVTPDLSVIHDSREFKKWTENVVVSFDELSMKGLHDSKRNRTPELIKQLLTASSSQERTFHTQSQQTYRIRATFCATTNKPLAESISDPTGMRRFWEIICKTTDSDPEFDWKTIEGFDWLDLWQSVDESLPTGYISPKNKKAWATMEAVQDTYCVSPSLRTWFEENYEPFWQSGLTKLTASGIAKDATLHADGVRAHSLLSLYGEYTDLMQEISNYPVSQQHFAACLRKLGVRTVPRSRSHLGTNYHVVKEIK